MSIRNPRRLVILFILLFPVVATAQTPTWTAPNSTTITTTNCATPCTVEINPGNTTNGGTALTAGGDIIATGNSIDVAANSTSGSAALSANAPASQTSLVLLRSGGQEAVYLRREANTNDFSIWTNNTERFRILANGNVGIGQPSPLFKLDVNGAMRASSFSNSTAAPGGYQFYATSDASMVSAAMQLRSNYSNYSTSFIGNLGQFGTYISHNREPQAGGFVDIAAGANNQQHAAHAVVGDTYFGRLFWVGNFVMEGSPATLQSKPRMVVLYNGNVGIGSSVAATNPGERLVVDGNIHVTGNINAKYQDLAEWVPSNSDLAPGTVVVLDPAIGNGVMASAAAYDTAVAGVVSAQPGIILGEAGSGKEQIATTGRVRVRVDATSAPIRVGDLLVTSDKAGLAMKSQPMDINGRRFHQPGTLIGKALEPLEGGQGEILVLLSLQ